MNSINTLVPGFGWQEPLLVFRAIAQLLDKLDNDCLHVASVCADLSSPQQLMPFKALELLPAASRVPQQQSTLAAASSMAAAAGSTGTDDQAAERFSLGLWHVVAACDGFSGRSLRKLPFLAHATSEGLPFPCSCLEFLEAMRAAAEGEKAERCELAHM